MTDQRIVEFFRLYNEEKLTVQQVADKYRLSKQFVAAQLKKHPDYHPKEDLAKRNESIIHYHQHRPEFRNKDIARIHGVSEKTIERVCKGLRKNKP